MTSSIAIIGAGMAGLACAQALHQAGHTVTVFEKSRGPSGRISTRLGEGWQCDHGAQYFTVQHPQFAEQVQRWQAAGVVELWQGKLYETDGHALLPKQSAKPRYVGVPTNTAPARQLAAQCQVQLLHTIDQIQLMAGGWHLRSKEHGVLETRFDQLVLAIPSPQAAVLLANSHPAFAQLASAVRMRGCWSVMARFETPLAVAFDGLFINQGPLSWVARDASKPGRAAANVAFPEVWILHASPEWSEAHLEEAPDAVIEQLLAAFIAVGGRKPAAVTAHRWRYADCEVPSQQQYAWDAQLQLGLCGDWLNGGKVEGAWISGALLAEQILKHSAKK